jgi:hypothetical protein
MLYLKPFSIWDEFSDVLLSVYIISSYKLPDLFIQI